MINMGKVKELEHYVLEWNIEDSEYDAVLDFYIKLPDGRFIVMEEDKTKFYLCEDLDDWIKFQAKKYDFKDEINIINKNEKMD